MTVQNNPRLVQYVAAGGDTNFAIPFRMIDATYATCYKRPANTAPNDAAQLLVLNVNYTITIFDLPNEGGTLTLTVPATAGDIVTIALNPIEQRLSDYTTGGPFDASTVNVDFDSLVLMIQSVNMYARSVAPYYNTSSLPQAADLVLPALGPSQSWRKSADGTHIEAFILEPGVVMPSVNNAIATFNGVNGTIQSSPVSVRPDGVMQMTGTNHLNISFDQAIFETDRASFAFLKDMILSGDLYIANNANNRTCGFNYAGTVDLYYSLPTSLGTIGSSFCLGSNSQDTHWNIIPGRNRLINGDMQIWQNARNFTGLVGVLYAADMWQCGPFANTTSGYVSRINGVTSGTYYLRCGRTIATTGTDNIVASQTMTINRCISAAGNKVSIRFRALRGADFSSAGNILNVRLNGGTGNTDVSNLTSVFNGLTNLTNNNFAITTNDNTYLISGITVGALITQLEIRFQYTPSGTAGADDWFQITDVQVEISNAPTPFDRLPFETQLKLCQAYFCKTYDYDTAPAVLVTNGARYATVAVSATPTDPLALLYNWEFPSQMRAVPTITFYNVSGVSTPGSWEQSDASLVAMTSHSVGEASAALLNNANANGNLLLLGHATANARLV